METAGFLIPRNREKVVEENDYIEFTLPYQSSANEVQVILDKSAKTDVLFYNGYLLRTKNGELRKIINYTGKSRICTLDKPLLSGKNTGDVIYLFKRSNVCLYYDEENSSFAMVKCDNRIYLERETKELTNLQIGNLTVANENKKAIVSGNLEIGDTIFVEKDADIKNTLNVGENITSKTIKIGDTVAIKENSIAIGNFQIQNNDTSLVFSGNTTGILEITENGDIEVNGNGLMLKRDSYLTNNCTSGFLGISGDIFHKTEISLFGEGHIDLTSESTITLQCEKTKISSNCEISGSVNVQREMTIENDLKVNGKVNTDDIEITGQLQCKSLTKQPNIDIVSCKNGEIIEINNVDLLEINHWRLLTFTLDVLPRNEKVDTIEIEFRVPEIEKLFSNKRGAVFYVNGYCDQDDSIDPIFSTIGYTIPNTQNGNLKFAVNSDSIHSLSVWCKYLV
jgi:predicted acyltransferase (DUF342 family)